MCPFVPLCHDSPSFFTSNLELHSSAAAGRPGYDSRPPPPPSGLPLPQSLGAAIQFTPPRRGGCAAVAQRTVPVRGDFMFALTRLFVTKGDVTVTEKIEGKETHCNTHFYCSMCFLLEDHTIYIIKEISEVFYPFLS